MREILHVLPCGALHTFNEHTYADIVNHKAFVQYMLDNIPREVLKRIKDPNTIGRKKKQWMHLVYARVMNKVWERIVAHILNADRVIIPFGKEKTSMLYIGETIGERKQVKYKKTKEIFWHTGGKRFEVVYSGVDHQHYFRMDLKHRAVLRRRITEGKNYHG